MTNELVWLKAYDEETRKDIQFSVPSSWLHSQMKKWATEDARTVEKDKESYISGRTDHLYEAAVNGEMDGCVIESILDIAKGESMIVETKTEGAVKDFSLREEIKVVSEQAGLKLSPEDMDQLVDRVQEWDDFLSIVAYFVKKEVKELAKEKNLSFNESELDEERDARQLTEFQVN